MKKILSVLALFAVCVFMSSCSTEADQQCSKIADAMLAGNWEEVSTLSDQLYAKKDECQARNLIDLTIAFNTVANNYAKDNTGKYEAIKKVIDCYETAMSKDAATAKKCEEVSKIDLASIVAQYKDMLPDFETTIAAEQAAATQTEESEETTEETEQVEEETTEE